MMMFSLIVVATDAATDDATNDATPTDGAEKKDWRVSNRFVSPRYSRQLRG